MASVNRPRIHRSFIPRAPIPVTFLQCHSDVTSQLRTSVRTRTRWLDFLLLEHWQEYGKGKAQVDRINRRRTQKHRKRVSFWVEAVISRSTSQQLWACFCWRIWVTKTHSYLWMFTWSLKANRHKYIQREVRTRWFWTHPNEQNALPLFVLVYLLSSFTGWIWRWDWCQIPQASLFSGVRI